MPDLLTDEQIRKLEFMISGRMAYERAARIGMRLGLEMAAAICDQMPSVRHEDNYGQVVIWPASHADCAVAIREKLEELNV